MSGQGGHGREGGQRYMRRQVGSPGVPLLRGFGEGLNDRCLIVLFLLDVEGQPLPQVVASRTAALCLRPRHRFTIGAAENYKSQEKEEEKVFCRLDLDEQIQSSVH